MPVLYANTRVDDAPIVVNILLVDVPGILYSRAGDFIPNDDELGVSVQFHTEFNNLNQMK